MEIPKWVGIGTASLIGIIFLTGRKQIFDTESFSADAKPPVDKNPFEHGDCHICARPFEFSKLARSLVQHYLKESDNGTKEWKTKNNPDGTRRTARNITGYELYTYGLDALDHYMFEGKESDLKPLVVELLRKSIVPNIIVGDVVQFIESLEIEGVEDLEPRFSKEFHKKWESESFEAPNMCVKCGASAEVMHDPKLEGTYFAKALWLCNRCHTQALNAEDFFLDSENVYYLDAEDGEYVLYKQEHGDHDEAHEKIDELIYDLDKLTEFCIEFLEEGAYGGESQGIEDLGDGLIEERVLYIEGSIELKFIWEDDENVAIRAKYTNNPESPIIYLPPAVFIRRIPEELKERIEKKADESICLMCGGQKPHGKVYCTPRCATHSNRKVSLLGGKKKGLRRADIIKAVLALKECGGEMSANQWAARVRDVYPTSRELTTYNIHIVTRYLKPDVYRARPTEHGIKTSGYMYSIVKGNCYEDWAQDRFH